MRDSAAAARKAGIIIEEYAESVRYIRGVAEKSGISIKVPRA
jgi:hypothetical protein